MSSFTVETRYRQVLAGVYQLLSKKEHFSRLKTIKI